MTPEELLAHKRAAKQLPAVPVFKKHSRNKLPKPFKHLGGPRIETTGVIEISPDHLALMYWRDGEILSDRSFYAYVYCKLADGNISPLFEFHWHPSHKPFHCKTPCNTTSNYTNRYLPGAPELSLKTPAGLDPKDPTHRTRLVYLFCKFCGIQPPEPENKTAPLFPDGA